MFGFGFGLRFWQNSYFVGALSVANWIFSLISNDSTTVTNATAFVWYNDAEIADGMSLVTLPDDTPIQNGMHYADTVAGGASLGEELLSDTTFDTPAYWDVLNGGSVSGGKAIWPANNALVYKNGLLTIGKRYQITLHNLQLPDNSALLNVFAGGFAGNDYAISGDNTITEHTFELVCASSTQLLIQSVNYVATPFTLDGMSVREVLPTYSFALTDGTKIAKTETLNTANGAVESLVAIQDRTDGEIITEAGTLRVVQTDEWIPVWVSYTVGTLDASLPSISVADIGSTFTDNTCTGTIGGVHTAEGLYSGLAATNYLLNSDAPATQTTGSLATGFYTLWMDGTGSADLTAGTATISTTGSATDGTPLTFEVTGAGTVTVTVAGTEDRFQLEGGTVPTQFIVTAGSTVTRSATVTTTPIAETKLTGNNEKIQVTFRPSVVGIEQWLFSDGTAGIYIDASNNVNFTDGTNTATGTATIAADTVYTVLVNKSSTGGVTITTNGVVDATEAGQTGEITWGATIYIGSKASALQFNGDIIDARTL